MFLRNRTLMAAVVLFSLAGCATLSVESDYDRQANFSGLKTYQWVSQDQPTSGNPRIDNSLVDERIRSAVDNALALKGYQLAKTGEPDFLVAYRAAIEGKMDVTTMSTPYMAPSAVDIRGGSYNGWNWAYGGTQTFVNQYEEGSVFVDIVDPKTKRLMWRGTGKDTVLERASIEKREARINAGVQKILSQFPPQQ